MRTRSLHPSVTIRLCTVGDGCRLCASGTSVLASGRDRLCGRRHLIWYAHLAGTSSVGGANRLPLVMQVRASSSFKGPSAPPRGRSLPHIIDSPAPPRPSFYVPPEERPPNDASLLFAKWQELSSGKATSLSTGHELSPDAADRTVVPAGSTTQRTPLGPGQDYAAEHQKRPPSRRQYMDSDAARLQSTSVHAGQSLLRPSTVVDRGDFDPESYREEGGSAHEDRPTRWKGTGMLRRAAYHAKGTMAEGDTVGAAGSRPQVDGRHRRSMFSQIEGLPFDEEGGGRPGGVFPEGHTPPTEEEQKQTLQMDMQNLERFSGTAQYPELLKAFRAKYGIDGTDTSTPRRVYSAQEMERGLEAQPIDIRRASPRLQARLTEGPRAYDPVTIFQQHGLARFEGYAFPPTTELGKLRGVDDLRGLQRSHSERSPLAVLRRTVRSLTGRRDTTEDYLVTGGKAMGDSHILNRTLGLDVVQRRQMRYMLTDFDYADRQTTFHVMMSYPYADWWHAFYMVLVGWCIYQVQNRWGAYEFYSEFLGLDLRQVPSAKRPFLAGVTILVMVFFLFHPLLVASVATTRAYRIVMKRPIGPP